MTDLQLSHLQCLLIERRRRLVCAYTGIDGRQFAVSRPSGQRSAKYDQLHLLDLSLPSMVQIVATTPNT